MKEVVFVTCEKIPLGTDDDKLVLPYLKDLGLKASFINWRHFPASLKEQAGLIILRSPWDYIFHLQDFLDFCQEHGPKLLNDSALVRWNHHKGYLKEMADSGYDALPCVGPSSVA